MAHVLPPPLTGTRGIVDLVPLPPRHFLRYRLYSFYRVQVIVMLGAFAAGDVAMLIGAVLTGNRPSRETPPLWFVAFFTFVVAWLAYWFLWRIAYWVEVRSDGFTWRTPIRSGFVPIGEVTAIVTGPVLMGTARIKTQSGSIILFPTSPFPAFADRAAQLYPQIEVAIGKFTRLGAGVGARLRIAKIGPLMIDRPAFEEGEG